MIILGGSEFPSTYVELGARAMSTLLLGEVVCQLHSAWEEELQGLNTTVLWSSLRRPPRAHDVDYPFSGSSLFSDMTESWQSWKAIVIFTPVFCVWVYITREPSQLSVFRCCPSYLFTLIDRWMGWLCVWAYVDNLAHVVQRLEDKLQELVLSYCVGSGDSTQVVRFGCKY